MLLWRLDGSDVPRHVSHIRRTPSGYERVGRSNIDSDDDSGDEVVGTHVEERSAEDGASKQEVGEDVANEPAAAEVPVRPVRERRAPAWMDDYVLSATCCTSCLQNASDKYV